MFIVIVSREARGGLTGALASRSSGNTPLAVQTATQGKPGLHQEETIMTKCFIVPTFIASIVLLTSLTGVAQEQSPSAARATGVAIAERAAEQAPDAAVTPQFVDPNRFFTGVCTVGPRSGDVLFRCYNLGFTNVSPRLVHCQTRNNPAEFVNYDDQFACQVIGTTLQDNGSVWVRIRRMDDGTGSSGWGQNLQINLWIVN